MKTKNTRKNSAKKLSENELYSDDLPARGTGWSKKEVLLFEPKTLVLIIITSAITLLFSFFGDQGVTFLTSVISTTPQHAPFDGTVAPIKQVPNWVKLTEAERKATYDQIPTTKLIPFPTYNAARLAMSVDGLKWNDPNDDQIRNEKITFAVPYLGSYRLDGIEDSGSHLAVDIKVPVGTPVQAIANGTVIKVDNGEGGFGHHIVIQHNNVPSFDDPNVKTTYYSSYSHLSVTQVKVNDVVTKGQQIALSGATGTATTPHVHYQIDNATAAWHPFWPFSTAEMNAAGYGFFEAINNGLNKDRARANTINPILYVQKYYNATSAVAQAPVVTNTTLQSNTPVQTITQSTATVDPYTNANFTILLPGGTSYEQGTVVPFAIQGFDGTGKMFSMPTFSEGITLTTKNNLGTLSRANFSAQDFSTGMMSGLVYSTNALGLDSIVLSFRGKQFASAQFEVREKTPGLDGFNLFPATTTVKKDTALKFTIQALDSSKNYYDKTLNMGGNTVAVSVIPATAQVSVTQLAESNFRSGEAQFNFTASESGIYKVVATYKGKQYISTSISVPNDDGTMPDVATAPEVPALPVDTATVATPTDTTTTPVVTPDPTPVVVTPVTPFADIDSNSKYFTALTALKNEGLIAGYADNTYHPEYNVTRAEAITFVLRVLSQEVKDQIRAIFPDVPEDQWFAKYVTTAFELGFVKGYPDGTFKPSVTVNLAEFTTMLFVAARADVDPVISAELPSGVVATDWFAPYIQAGIKKGILVVENNTVDAGRALTRGDVAEILYRLRTIVNQLKR